MFEVWRRVHEASKPNHPTVFYETVSVYNAGSSTTRITANQTISDAKSIINAQSASAKDRVGFNGAALKFACLIRDGWALSVTTFNQIGSFADQEAAYDYRDNYLIEESKTSSNIILGRAGFRYKTKNGNNKSGKNTFYQPISKTTSIALNRINNLVDHFSMRFNSNVLSGQKMNNGSRLDNIGMIYLYCANKPKHIPSNFATINGVRFEEGEFKTYGQLFKKLLDAGIIS